MLSARQCKYIQERLYSSDHDFFFWSGMLGEPFLEKDVLHFVDGQTLSIIGFLLDSQVDERSSVERISAVIKRWSRVPSVMRLNYMGPWHVDLSSAFAGGLSQTYLLEPDEYNVDMFINLHDPSVLKTRNARESLRKAQRRDLIVSLNKPSFLRYEHIDLIRQLAMRDSLLPSDVSWLTNVTWLVGRQMTTFFEAEVEGHLAGFAVTHEFFERIPILVLACFSQAYPGVADAIYGAMIHYYREQGALRLGIGYSLDEGLYQFKIKWGGVTCNQPFYQLVWTRDDYVEPSTDCLGWVCDLLMSKVRASQI